ncbi:L-type lectin-domain containing receptor kinase V.9-like [Durio zibethinus]|uniref:non-specific serine/threonine protein kinase n=1 Tax=Durio zibethinus TaxID=66656 RepID=A0A6P5WQ99_DURZI|nr:L-type lectin-domain containing receptor kinase V.9-like [Durio zibethinus]
MKPTMSISHCRTSYSTFSSKKKKKKERINQIQGSISMFFKGILMFLVLVKVVASSNEGFIFNGFGLDLVYGQRKSLELGGVAELRNDGVFELTNGEFQIGRVFYSVPFKFKNSSNAEAFSFSTTFVFAIVPENSRGNGLAFVLAPSKEFTGVVPSQHLGLFNRTNHGNSSNHIIAIELDTFPNHEFEDIDDNHVGIDINSLKSAKLSPAGYVSSSSGEFRPVDLASGERIQLWVEYDSTKHQFNVTLSPITMNKPKVPLLSMDINLSPFILKNMHIGFSSEIGVRGASTYVLGWSFQMDGKAEDLNLAKLSSVPSTRKEKSRKKEVILAVGLSLSGVLVLVVICSVMFFLTRKKATFAEILEDWEVEFGSHRFSYKDLYVATKGFNEKELLGQGGFGQVYRGELPVSKVQIAVKRIFRKSQDRMKEFIAEIVTIGRMRHPNLARVLGYCRGKYELLLVYEYLPNGSLDKFLHNEQEIVLNWNRRFSIIKDVASAIAYLHDECLEGCIHRDIKASNVLLDDDLNGKLGDFGLARCRKHAQETTHIAGTFGYMAPELAKTGKASTSTDVYAFGAFCLEVVCGRRPINWQASAEQVHLVDWVFKCWDEGDILKTADSKLGKDFEVWQVDLVLKLGLLCLHSVAAFRPTMSQVTSYLKGQDSLPENLEIILHKWEFMEESANQSAPWTKDSIATFDVTESFQSSGR